MNRTLAIPVQLIVEVQNAECKVQSPLAIGYRPFAMSPQCAARFMVPMRVRSRWGLPMNREDEHRTPNVEHPT